MEVDKSVHSAAIGKAGELRIRSELLLRGFSCASFDYDNGTDIVLNNGKRIGVKTSSRPIYHKKSYSWRYYFSIKWPKIRWGDGNSNYKKVYLERDWNDYIDFWILWCIKDNLFYIVPNGALKVKFAIVINTPDELRKYKKHTWKETHSQYVKYRDNWEQLR